MDAGSPDAKYNIALILMDKGMWDKAIEKLNGAIERSRGGRLVRIKNALAVCYANKGDLAEAGRQLNEALLIDRSTTRRERTSSFLRKTSVQS